MNPLPLSQAIETHSSVAIHLANVVFHWPQESRFTIHIDELIINKGAQIFIAGPSGSGKSTLLGLIAGILTPSSGNIMVNGCTINQLSPIERDVFRGNNIGFIFQQFNLIPYLTVIENVVIPCHLSTIRYANSIEQEGSIVKEAEALLERLDLSSDLWHHKAHQLSVGQQQRVAAARALIGKPPILIADEPTSALDADRRRDFLNLLLSACTETGATLLFVSHDQDIMMNFSESIYLNDLNQGEKIE